MGVFIMFLSAKFRMIDTSFPFIYLLSICMITNIRYIVKGILKFIVIIQSFLFWVLYYV